MASTVTFRLNAETERMLRDLATEARGRSRAIRDALRARWSAMRETSAPSSWQLYASLGIRAGKPRRDQAKHLEKLLREKLLAKRSARTL